MGCGQSRDETRKADYGADLNIVAYGFKATGKTDINNLHPYGILTTEFLGGDTKEAAEGVLGAFKDGKFEKADALKAGATTLFNELKALLEWAKANVDENKKEFGLRFNRGEVEKDIGRALELISASYPDEASLKWPEAAAATGDDADKDKEKKEEPAGAENDGGDEQQPAADAGEQLLPANLLKAFLEAPVFAALMKQQVLAADIQPAFNALNFNNLNPMAYADLTFGLAGGQPKVDFKFAASVLFFYVDNQEKAGADKEVWFSANFTDADIEELGEATGSEDKIVVFPGVIEVHGTKEEACAKVTAAAPDAKAKNQVIFKYLNGSYYELAEPKALLVARFAATCTQADEDKEAKIWTLTDAPGVLESTVAAWKAKAGK